MTIDLASVVGLQRDIEDARALALQAARNLRRLRLLPGVDAAQVDEARGWLGAALAEVRRCRARLKEAMS
jgi:hypothetical protein